MYLITRPIFLQIYSSSDAKEKVQKKLSEEQIEKRVLFKRHQAKMLLALLNSPQQEQASNRSKLLEDGLLYIKLRARQEYKSEGTVRHEFMTELAQPFNEQLARKEV